VRIVFQIRTSPILASNFEHFDVFLPFFTRGNIVSTDISAPLGTITVEKKRTIVWRIGTKFARSSEASIQGVVSFDGSTESITGEEEDPLCTGLNAYAKVNFRIVNYTLSGVDIDPKNVVVYPGNKPPLQVERITFAKNYLIWSSLSTNVRYAAKPVPHEFVEH